MLFILEYYMVAIKIAIVKLICKTLKKWKPTNFSHISTENKIKEYTAQSKVLPASCYSTRIRCKEGRDKQQQWTIIITVQCTKCGIHLSENKQKKRINAKRCLV